MATFVKSGEVIDYTPSAAVLAGDVAVVGTLVGVVTVDGAADVPVGLAVEGIFTFPKTSTDVIAAGTKVYWDTATSLITATAGSLKAAGYTIAAAANPSSTVAVKLSR